MKNTMVRTFKKENEVDVLLVYTNTEITKTLVFEENKHISIDTFELDGPRCFNQIKELKAIGYKEILE